MKEPVRCGPSDVHVGQACLEAVFACNKPSCMLSKTSNFNRGTSGPGEVETTWFSALRRDKSHVKPPGCAFSTSPGYLSEGRQCLGNSCSVEALV